MVRINFSDNIKTRGRDLHLQTNTMEAEIVSTLFDSGRVLGKEKIFYDTTVTDNELRKQVEQFHMDKMTSIELLFTISARVKTVRHPPSLNKLGLQYLKWNLLDEAISEFELALQYDSEYTELYLNLGEAYLRRGGIEEAVQILNKGVKIAPTFADLWSKLGVSYQRIQKYKNAIEAFEKAIKINPSYDEPYFFLTLLYLEVIQNKIKDEYLPTESGCIVNAKENLKRAVTLSNRFRNKIIQETVQKLQKEDFNQALILLKKAEQQLSKVVELSFQDFFYLNFMYGEKGREPQIVQKYIDKLESISREYSEFPDIHNNLGIAYLIQCRELFNKALNQFRIAFKINNKYKRAERNLKLAENDGKGFLILLRAMLK
jgi:tetratricopeptide (TPR) repeat protein